MGIFHFNIIECSCQGPQVSHLSFIVLVILELSVNIYLATTLCSALLHRVVSNSTQRDSEGGTLLVIQWLRLP